MPVVTIENRSFITASGEDAVDLLQSLITTDLALVQPGEAWPGALLTPQGKILFEFLVSRPMTACCWRRQRRMPTR
jgi:folate-binding Fe-S cluster repair protein YgfZ